MCKVLRTDSDNIDDNNYTKNSLSFYSEPAREE